MLYGCYFSRDDFDYIAAEKPENNLSEQDNENEEVEDTLNDLSSDLETGVLLNNVSVSYPKEDESNIILTTNLDKSAKIKIFMRIDVNKY